MGLREGPAMSEDKTPTCNGQDGSDVSAEHRGKALGGWGRLTFDIERVF